MTLKDKTLRDLLTKEKITSIQTDMWPDAVEYLDWKLEEYFSPLIGGYGENTSYPKWVWVTVVRTFGEEPEGEVLGTHTDFWDGLEALLNHFGTLNPMRPDTGSWDATIEDEFRSNDTRGVDFEDAISAVRFEVTWKGEPSCVVMESVRVGRLPRMG